MSRQGTGPAFRSAASSEPRPPDLTAETRTPRCQSTPALLERFALVGSHQHLRVTSNSTGFSCTKLQRGRGAVLSLLDLLLNAAVDIFCHAWQSSVPDEHLISDGQRRPIAGRRRSGRLVRALLRLYLRAVAALSVHLKPFLRPSASIDIVNLFEMLCTRRPQDPLHWLCRWTGPLDVLTGWLRTGRASRTLTISVSLAGQFSELPLWIWRYPVPPR